MISVDKQYIISFSLGDNKDFIKRTELNEFTIIEEAGNLLPTFELEFNTFDETILPKLNETQPLNLLFGVDRDTAFDVPLSISTFVQIENGREGVTINIKGIYRANEYITQAVLNITNKQSGIEAIIDAASQSFKVESNITKSTDSQNWIQYNISNKKFVTDTLLHSYKNNTFFIPAITIEGKFVLKDIMEDLARGNGEYDYRLIMNPKKTNDIPYDNNPVITSNTGFLNNVIGYGREVFEQNLEASTVVPFIETSEPIIALTRNLAKDSTINRNGGTKLINENVHENYWKAYFNNLTNIVSLGNISVLLTVDNYFYPIHPLHLVMLNIPSKIANHASEYLAGLYYTSKVSRTWSNNKFTTSILLCRESVNQVK